MSAICSLVFVGGGSRGITHEGPFPVAIPCESFVMISLVILNHRYFIFLPFTFETPIHGPKI